MKENKNLEFKSTITNTFLKTVSAYRRSDTASIEADQAELKELVLQGSNLYFEELPCGRADLAFKELNSKLWKNQRIIAGNAQFTGIAAGRGVGFTTGLLHLRKGLGMRETPIRPHSWH